MKGGLIRNNREGLHHHRRFEGRNERRNHPQSLRRQDKTAQQAHLNGLLRRSWRHRYDSSKLLLADDADRRSVQFAEYIQANIQLYSMRNDTDLGPGAVASFVRGELAKSLRSRKPYNVNLLLGGIDPITKKPSLYWMDYLASYASLPYAAHGYAQYVFHGSLSSSGQEL